MDCNMIRRPRTLMPMPRSCSLHGSSSFIEHSHPASQIHRRHPQSMGLKFQQKRKSMYRGFRKLRAWRRRTRRRRFLCRRKRHRRHALQRRRVRIFARRRAAPRRKIERDSFCRMGVQHQKSTILEVRPTETGDVVPFLILPFYLQPHPFDRLFGDGPDLRGRQ